MVCGKEGNNSHPFPNLRAAMLSSQLGSKRQKGLQLLHQLENVARALALNRPADDTDERLGKHC